MKHFCKLQHLIFLGLLASIFLWGSSAMGAINLPTAIEFEKAISFQKPDGETIKLKPGIYEVELGGEKELNFDPLGGGKAITVGALPAVHNQPLEEPKALLTPSPDNNPDKQHVVLWIPDGLAMEAVGSYSGVFSRSTMTWGTDDAASADPLTVEIEKAIYFKTIGGDPQIIQPGEYEVAMVVDSGLKLTSVGGKGEESTIERESLGASVAVLLPEFNDNPDLELLMLGTAGGRSVVALGSHSGTFPRGIWGKIKKKAKGGLNKAKKFAKKKARGAYRAGKGKVKKYAKRAYKGAGKHARKYAGKAKNYARKHGKRLGRRAYNYGVRQAKRACGGSRTAKCLQLAGAAAAAS